MQKYLQSEGDRYGASYTPGALGDNDDLWIILERDTDRKVDTFC